MRFLSTRVGVAGDDDMSKLMKVVRYCNGTRDLGIKFRYEEGNLKSYAYIDAAYGIHADGKSHSSLAIMMMGGCVIFKSVKQGIVTKSSTESELVATSDLGGIAVYLNDLLPTLHTEDYDIIVMQDNKSCIQLLLNGRLSCSDMSKHIAIRYFWLRERFIHGNLKVEFCPTQDMIANLGTKVITGTQFKDERSMLLNSTVV